MGMDRARDSRQVLVQCRIPLDEALASGRIRDDRWGRSPSAAQDGPFTECIELGTPPQQTELQVIREVLGRLDQSRTDSDRLKLSVKPR